MEANALGVLTIAAGVGGIPEMIHEGVNGFCIQPWSVASAVDKICFLAENMNILTEMKAKAKTFAQSEFSYERMLTDYTEAFNGR